MWDGEPFRCPLLRRSSLLLSPGSSPCEDIADVSNSAQALGRPDLVMLSPGLPCLFCLCAATPSDVIRSLLAAQHLSIFLPPLVAPDSNISPDYRLSPPQPPPTHLQDNFTRNTLQLKPLLEHQISRTAVLHFTVVPENKESPLYFVFNIFRNFIIQ